MCFFRRSFYIVIYSFIMNFNLNAVEIQKVTILADENYPPYTFVENGVLKGIYVDIVMESAKLISARYKVEIVGVPWKRGIETIKAGKALAILPPYKHLDKRRYMWPYSLPLLTENVVAFCHKNIDILKFIRNPNKKIIAPLNIGINTDYLILNKELEQAKEQNNIIVRENKSTSANIMKLYFGRIDCYLNDKLSTLWELSKISKDSNVNFDNIFEALLVTPQTAHIGYTNDDNHSFHYKGDFVLRMDKALAKFMSSNKYQEILSRYQ